MKRFQNVLIKKLLLLAVLAAVFGSGMQLRAEAAVPDGTSEPEIKSEKVTYTTTYVYNRNGATRGKVPKAKIAYLDRYTIEPCAYKRTGYTFTGWNTKADGSGTSYKPGRTVQNKKAADRTVILYAQWKENRYTVRYVKRSAYGGKMAGRTVRYTQRFVLQKNKYTRKGYTFTGWNTKANGSGTAYKNRASVSKLTKKNGGTVRLYAQWKKKSYAIVYKLNGGKNAKANPASYTVTTDTIILKAPKRSGYLFLGWYTDKACTKKIEKIKKGSTGKLRLYAKWRVIPHALSMDRINAIRASYDISARGYGGLNYMGGACGDQALMDSQGIDGRTLTRGEKSISLTFQEGCEFGYTAQLLNLLKKKKVKAHFYVTHSYCAAQPALVQRMIDEGHTVGMHTYSCPEGGIAHQPLEAIMNDALQMQNYMKKTFGYTVTEYNYNDGVWSPASARMLSEMGYRVILCSQSYSDYSPYAAIDAGAVLGQLTAGMRDGSIFAFHVANPATIQIAGPLIDAARARGLSVRLIE